MWSWMTNYNLLKKSDIDEILDDKLRYITNYDQILMQERIAKH